jgi:hypothetical protein
MSLVMSVFLSASVHPSVCLKLLGSNKIDFRDSLFAVLLKSFNKIQSWLKSNILHEGRNSFF